MRRSLLLPLLPAILGWRLLACTTDNETPRATPTVDAATDTAPSPELDAAATSTSIVTAFDATAYELAEGLVLRDGKAYVGLAPLGTILGIGPDGARRTYASVPPGYNAGYTLGLAFDAQGDLFVLETKNDPDAGAQLPGVYKIPKGSTSATTPFASDATMTFPNGIVASPRGGLLVTDSAVGKVFRVDAAGAITTWKADPELVGTTACAAPLPFPIGANGIVATDTEVFVTNTANGSLVGIAVNADGSAGALRVIVKDCANAGFDGLARAQDGTFVVAQNGAPGRVVRVSASGAITVLPTPGLDGPASVALGTWGGLSSALVTSSAFFSIAIDGGTPRPSLAVIAPLL